MKKKNILTVTSLLLCISLLVACGTATSRSALEETQETGTDMETASDGLTDEAAYSEESDVQIGLVRIGSVGTVEMTSLSSEESRAFEGKEMTADADYLEQAKSSDVYYCVEPLNRIEVHPIKQWAKDYSFVTDSDPSCNRSGETHAGSAG